MINLKEIKKRQIEAQSLVDRTIDRRMIKFVKALAKGMNEEEASKKYGFKITKG